MTSIPGKSVFESGKERDVVGDGAEELERDLVEINGETFEFRVTERRVRRFVCCRYDLSLETLEEGQVAQEFVTTLIRERGAAEVDNDEGTRKIVEESHWESDVSILEDVEGLELMKLVKGSYNLIDRCRVLLLSGLGRSKSLLRNREVETESLFSEFGTFLESLAATILLFLCPAEGSNRGGEVLFARNGENAVEVQTRQSVARDLLANDGETEDILVFRVLVDSLLECSRETIQTGIGRRHLREEESYTLQDMISTVNRRGETK